MSVKFTTAQELPAKEKQALDEFMQRHPEIANLHTQPNFLSARNADLKLPLGVIACLGNDSKLSTSLLPEQQCGVVSLYEIGESFSEIEHLGQRAQLAERTKSFLSKTGLGPSESDIGLPTGDFLPKHWGQDLRQWKPYFGEHGFVSVVSSSANGFEKSYYLLVSVPNLPFANEALQSLSLMPIKEFAKHENVSIAQTLAQRNANRIAQLFADTFKIELRHRRPDDRSINGDKVAVPLATTMNSLFSPAANHKMNIHTTGVGQAMAVSNADVTLLPISAKQGAVITNRRVYEPIAMPVTSTMATKKTVQDIGKTFLTERTFWSQKDKATAPEVLLYDYCTLMPAVLAQKYDGQVLAPVFLVANQ